MIPDVVVTEVFFFQAEGGIRDIGVTGVQTCALPISPQRRTSHVGADSVSALDSWQTKRADTEVRPYNAPCRLRSEERRVGKECRAGWSQDDLKKKRRKASRTMPLIHTVALAKAVQDA